MSPKKRKNKTKFCLFKSTDLLFFILLGSFLLYSNSLLRAEEYCVKELSYDLFQAFVFKSSPLVSEVDQKYSQELARSLDVKTWSNPELQLEQVYTSMNLGGADDPQSYISIAQPMKLSNLLNRRKLADLIARSGSIDKQVNLIDLSYQARLFYQSLTLNLELKTLLKESIKLAHENLEIVKDGVKAGLYNKGEQYLFEAEHSRIQAALSGAEAKASELKFQSRQLLGLPCYVSFKRVPELEALPALKEVRKLFGENETNLKARKLLLKNIANEELRMARVDRVPSFSPRFVYQHTNDGGDFLGVGITVALPVWNQNQAEIERAKSKLASSESNLNVFNDGDDLLESLYHAASTVTEQLRILESQTTVAFKKSYIANQELFKFGKGSALNVWQAFRAMQDSQLEILALKADALVARSKLGVFVGKEL